MGISVHSPEPSRCASRAAEMESCPSEKTSASTRTWSPTVRFAGNRPPSTSGETPSIMTRFLPSDSVRFFMAAPCLVSRLGAYLSLLHQSLVKADSLLGDGCPAEG